MNKFQNLTDRTRSILFLLLAAVLCILPFFLTPIYYMVSDDYLLNYIANGSYGADGSAHLVYIHYTLGVLLKLLYGVSNSVNWYLVLQIAMLIISFYALYRAVWNVTQSFVRLIPVIAANALIVNFFLTYTVTAFILTAAGAALWYETLCAEKHSRFAAFLGSILLVTGYALRSESFFPVILMVLPLFLWKLLPLLGKMRRGEKAAENGRLLRRRILPPLLIFAALFLTTTVIDRLAYAPQEWSEFLEYTDSRSRVVDYSSAPYSEISSQLSEIGLTEIDYYLLRGWKYCEKNVFSQEVLEKTADICADSVTLRQRLNYGRDVLNMGVIMLLLLPVFLLLIFLLLSPGYPVLAGICAVLFYEGILGALIFVRMRFVVRVSAPLTMAAIFILCLAEMRRTASVKSRMRSVLRFALCAGLSAAMIFGTVTFIRDYRRSNSVSRVAPFDYPKSQVTQTMYENQDMLYIIDAGILSVLYYFGTEAKDVLLTDRFDNIVRSGSWDSYSPRYYAQVSRFIENPDRLLTSLATEDNVVYVTTNEALMPAFLEEQTGTPYHSESQGWVELGTRLFTYVEGEGE